MDSEKCDSSVPFFLNTSSQIRFEFFYLILILLAVVAATAFTSHSIALGEISPHLGTLIYSAFGGVLGGWAYTTKWFYRVTAKGRGDQYKYQWQSHKFYWRIFSPFVAGTIAFAIYLLLSSGVIPIVLRDPASGRTAFGLCFFLGYFSDLALSAIARWAETWLNKMAPKQQ